MSESELLELARLGDSAAFGLLVRDNQSRLRGFLRRLARGDYALADDLAQETFLEAWRKIAQFRAEGSFFGWLARIAYSRYLMTARKRKLETLDESVEQLAAPISIEPDMRIDLEKAMAKLALPERAALTICFALGFTNEEGAEMLGMPVGTLKSHIARAREKLRTLLEVV